MGFLNSFGVNCSKTAFLSIKRMVKLLCTKDVKERANATPQVNQINDNCHSGASNPQPPAFEKGSNSGNQYWESVLVPLY